jgi:glutamyl-tRNA reductase
MKLLSIGINHRTASVEVRERMWLSPEETVQALAALREKFFEECMLVSTCNRTEVYGILKEVDPDVAAIKKFLIDMRSASDGVQPDHFIAQVNGAAVHHLFKVAAGVDSMVIGDIQVLNQIKEAFQISRSEGAMGPALNKLMQATLHVGKRTRTETTICEGAVSVSYAAVELAGKIFADLTRRSALLVGAGETGELTLKHLVSKGVGRVKIANRTREKAEALVADFGGEVVDFGALTDALRTVDIVIISVNSPFPILSAESVGRVMRQRSHNPLFIIDIGVPRNVDPASRKIDNVFLYDIDSLSAIVDRNVVRRKAEIPKVTRIIREELVSFFRWYNSLEVAPTIQDLRNAFEGIRVQEVEKNLNRFRPEDRELVELVTRRIVNKILHQPMTTLKQGAENGSRGTETLLRIKALRELFGIASDQKDSDDE